MKMKMNRTRAIIYLVVTLVIVGIMGTTVLTGLPKWDVLGSWSGTGSAKNITQGLDLKGGTSITFEVDESNGEYSSDAFNDTLVKMEKRVQQFSTEAVAHKEGDNRIAVEIPGEYDSEKVMNELGKPGTLYFCTATEDTPTEEQINNKEYVEIEDQSSGEKAYYQVWVTGDEIVKAEGITGTDQDTKGIDYKVTLQFNDSGAQNFADMTTSAIGSQTYIIYDGEIISAPNVNQTITGGQAEITGMGSLEAAEELASFFNIGKLDLKLDLLSYKYVSEQDNK